LHNLSVDSLIKQFMDLEKNADDIRSQIKRKVEYYREAWDQEYSRIFPAQQT